MAAKRKYVERVLKSNEAMVSRCGAAQEEAVRKMLGPRKAVEGW